MTSDRNPWVAIMRAAAAKRGLSLSWVEVQRMACNDAVYAAAESCESECVCDIMGDGTCAKCKRLLDKLGVSRDVG